MKLVNYDKNRRGCCPHGSGSTSGWLVKATSPITNWNCILKVWKDEFLNGKTAAKYNLNYGAGNKVMNEGKSITIKYLIKINVAVPTLV